MKRETTGPPAAIRLTADRSEIQADGEDLVVLTVEVLDAKGRPVPTANDTIAFAVNGPAALIGAGNGDPNSHESDKEPTRSLFNGLAQVLVQASKIPGEIQVEASQAAEKSPSLAPARITIRATEVASRLAVL